MEFTLEPPRKTRVKPWAAVVRLTPAMLACLEGQGSGAASITLSATDNVLRIGDNSFNFTCIPEEVPGDLVRGSLELCEEPCRRSGVQRGLEMETGTEKVGAPPRSLEVAGSLQCRLQPKRVMAGSDGLAASVKRRVEEKVAEKESRKAVLVDYIAPAAVATTTTAAAAAKRQKQPRNKAPAAALSLLEKHKQGAAVGSARAFGGASGGRGRGRGVRGAVEVGAASGGRAGKRTAPGRSADEQGTDDGGAGFADGTLKSKRAKSDEIDHGRLEGRGQVSEGQGARRHIQGSVPSQSLAITALALAPTGFSSAAAPSPGASKISDRLAALAAAAARSASGRAANQLRAVLLTLLCERPLTFAAIHAAAVSDAVKKVASYRAPGRYHLLDAETGEGADLLRDAEASREMRLASAVAAAAVAAAAAVVLNQGLKVLTPPLQVPATSAHAHRAMIKRGFVGDFADGLTDEDREGGMTPDYSVAVGTGATARPCKPRQALKPSGVAAGSSAAAGVPAAAGFAGPVPPRVAGDVDDSWMAYCGPAAAEAEAVAPREGGGHGGDRASGSGGVAGGGFGGDGSILIGGEECPELTCDAEFHSWSDEYTARYSTYIAMHGALEANALEFRTLMESRDAAVARDEGGGRPGRGRSGNIAGGSLGGAAGGIGVADDSSDVGVTVDTLSRRMSEFRVVRHRRYGPMSRVFDALEAELGAIKNRVNEYAARVASA